jgi:hypothetical protein
MGWRFLKHRLDIAIAHWLSLTNEDIASILFLTAVFGGTAFLVVTQQKETVKQYHRATNFGFDPEWNCLSVPMGDPFCFKKPSDTIEPIPRKPSAMYDRKPAPGIGPGAGLHLPPQEVSLGRLTLVLFA